jgi:regulator of sigma E protease
LAIINLVPIPILDGGHLLFFLIELIKGRPVNLKIREVAQQIGLFVILLLVILVFYNDIFRYKDNILEFLKGIF